MIQQIRQFWQEDDGATAIEYGLIAGLVAVAIIGGLMLVSENLNSLFGSIGSTLETAVPAGGGEAAPGTNTSN